KAKETSVDNVDLKELSEKLKKANLAIGRDGGCEIPISHDSVEKRHAEIRSGREGTPTPVYIKPVGLSDVKVNNFSIDEEVKLNDRDMIRIGAFEFVYSNSHLKQVVVHYKDGEVKYGVPLTWNIEEDGFLLRPEKEAAGDLQLFIPFKDLKAVFFVKHFDKEIARKMKLSSIYAKRDHIRVDFLDGERFEGYTMQDYNEQSPRFFVAPKVEPGKEENTICALVERQFAKKIEVLGKQTANASPT
ncbi:MAG: FHA domain-containing protein, partial [Candidatus Lindowbacteria bacterium]|nr:FHA domain-containing protein [Candidatus Lindowbacteria bacterium]